MKYLLMGEERKVLYVEGKYESFRYNKKEDKWVPGGFELFDARVGFDASEPEDSPYRFGNTSCMEEIVEISKNEAEEFIGREINDNEIKSLFKFNN